VIVTFAIILFEVLGAVYQRYLDAMIAPAFDRITGLLAGAVVGAFEVTVMLIVGIGHRRSSRRRNGSTIHCWPRTSTPSSP
jgi:hypothetical protein